MKPIRARYIILFMSVALSLNTWGQQPETLFEQANQHYAEENYQQAIDLYEQVLKQGVESAELYFNLGNAWYRRGEMPEAVLYYEKARLLQPRDEEIQHNLRIATQLTGDEIEAVPEFFLTQWRKTLMHALSVDTWALLGLIAFAISMAGLALYFGTVYARRKRLGFTVAVAFFLLAAASLSLGAGLKNELTSHKQAIVFTPSVTVRSAPNEQSTSLFVVHEGTKVDIQETSGNWYEIRLANGEVGWLRQDDVRKI